MSCTQRSPRPFAHGCSPRHWYAHQRACCRRPPSGGVWARWIDPRCPCTRKGTHPSSLGALVFLCWACVGLLSGKPLAGSPQPACRETQAGIGRYQWSAVARGRRRYTSPVVGDTAYPALHLQDGLHQQVGVIAPQVVEHHRNGGGFGVQPQLEVWAAPRYLPVMWQWSRTESPSRGSSHTWHVSAVRKARQSPPPPPRHGLRIS